jgi:predicted SAM-dependent methyltransferase
MLAQSTLVDFHSEFSNPLPRRRVLNVGAGSANAGKLHEGFNNEKWQETRLDIDPRTNPHLVGSVTAMTNIVPDSSFDAIWCSHVLEHLNAHDVITALRECHRVLRPDGFAVVTSPDLMAVARQVLAKGLDDVAYQSRSGPITALDMLFGHGASISAGHTFMAHKTGFTVERLGRLATEAGFSEARVAAGKAFDLWAVLTMPRTNSSEILASFGQTNVGQLCF